VQECESAPTTSSPGSTKAALGEDGVADAALAHLEVPLDAHVARELARHATEAALAASLAGWKWSCTTAMRLGSHTRWAPIWSRMILPAGGMVRVVAHREVDPGQDQVTRHDRVPPAGAGEDLLGHGHTHGQAP